MLLEEAPHYASANHYTNITIVVMHLFFDSPSLVTIVQQQKGDFHQKDHDLDHHETKTQNIHKFAMIASPKFFTEILM